MKHSMIWKNTLREIKGSLGRFLAIFAIVALGVGFFAGLKITKSVFLKSMTNYLNTKDFYDYRILGSLGFSQDQVDFFAAREDVVSAEGAFFHDMYYTVDGGSLKVGRFHSITEKLNKIELTAGRMPVGDGEILVDDRAFSRDALGKSVVFEKENDESDLDQFHRDSFEIVGIVKSPLYIQFERGNSSLGSGSVDAFFYLPKEAFCSEDFTEIYVRFDQEYELYSSDYTAYMEQKDESWENIANDAGHQRFLELPSLIEQAQNELDEKRNEALEELDKAKRELEDAETKLADAERKLAEGEEELKKGEEELQEAKQELEDAKSLVEEKQEELENAKKQIEEGEEKIARNEKIIQEKDAEVTAGRNQLETSRMTLQMGEMQEKLTMQGLISEQKSIDSAKEELEERIRNVELLEQLAKTLGQEEYYAKRIAEEKAKIEADGTKLDNQTKDLHTRYLECLTLADEVKAGKKEFEEAEKKLQEGEKALEAGKAELLQGKKDLLEARKKVTQGEADLKDAKLKITDGEKEIAEGEQTLAEKNQEWEDGLAEFEEGKKEYQDGKENYEKALTEFQEKMDSAQQSIWDLKKQFDEGREPEVYLLGRNTNIGYVCFENDSAIVDGIANVFPVFFFLVAALVCVTTMNRMVEEQRTQIGVLKALGYHDGTIMFKFLFYAGLAAVSGCVIGYAGGTILFPFVIWKVYGIMYTGGGITFTFRPVLAAFSMIVALLCSVGATYLSCGKELSGQAATLMRPRAPKAGKRVLLERIPFIWKRLSFLRKVAVRNVMRYQKRLFMMVLGIGGCTSLIITGFGIKDSITGVADMQYTEIQKYDIGVMLKKDLDMECREKLEALRQKGMEAYLPYQESTLDLIVDKEQRSVTVLTFSADLPEKTFAEYLDFHKSSGEHVSFPKAGEVVITEKLARQYHVRVGDKIRLRDEAMKETEAVVAGIVQNYINNFVFLVREEFEPNAIYVKVDKEANLRRLSTALMKEDYVANVSVIQDFIVRFNKMMSSLNLIVILVTASAAGLAFIVQFNLTNINITERIREIATIKVLGFFSGETALYVFRENIILTFLGAFVGLGMGKALCTFVISEINVDIVEFAVRIRSMSYVYGILLTFLFSISVNFFMRTKLENINMTESLKSVD